MQADVGKGRNTVKDKRMTEKRCSRQEVDSMDIYFLRHGETKWNTRGRIQGQKNTRLSEKGLEQARLTAEGMKDIPFDIIYSSPLERAYETAQIVRGERNIPIIRDDRLKEDISTGFLRTRLLPENKDISMTRSITGEQKAEKAFGMSTKESGLLWKRSSFR